jgi:hypothetical protein
VTLSSSSKIRSFRRWLERTGGGRRRADFPVFFPRVSRRETEVTQPECSSLLNALHFWILLSLHFMSRLVSSRLVSSCLVLSCPALPYPALPCLVLLCLVFEITWSFLAISDDIMSNFVSYYLNKRGGPDVHRAGLEIISDCVDGSIPLFFLPPKEDQRQIQTQVETHVDQDQGPDHHWPACAGT